MIVGMKRRCAALALDYGVVLVGLVVIAAIAVPLYAADLLPWRGHTDAVSFAVTVVPAWAYLTVAEAGALHATWGKRRMGLRVQPGSAGRIAVRNAVKVAPWALAHLGVAALWVGADGHTLVAPRYAWLSIIAAYALVIVTVALAWSRADRATLHDLIAGTRVSGAEAP